MAKKWPSSPVRRVTALRVTVVQNQTTRAGRRESDARKGLRETAIPTVRKAKGTRPKTKASVRRENVRRENVHAAKGAKMTAAAITETNREIQMSRSSKFFTVAILGVLIASCDKERVFDEYKSVGSAWHKDSIASFDLPEMDTTKTYNLFVNVRSNDAYPYSNLFLIVQMDHPGRLSKVDTLEYVMADEEGNLLGNGFSDIKESKLFYKERVRFKKGNYKVHIKHAVRETGKVQGVPELKGISEVGFRIEYAQ